MAVTYIAAAEAAAAGKSVVGVGKCPGSDEEIVSPPVVIFNPEAYAYFRWSGTVVSNNVVEPNPITQTINTDWFIMSPGRYGEIIITATGPFLLPPGSLGAWSSSYKMEFRAVTTPQQCNGTNWSGPVAVANAANPGSSNFFIPGYQVYHPCYEPTELFTDTVFQTVSGTWEFSNNQSTVLATWSGT